MKKRGKVRAALLKGFLLSSACGASAQTHVVKKPETVVRAVGVYEWTGSETKPTASRFVPVTLFIDGHLEDAAVYLARPVPFALQTGTIFELEHAGVPEGTLELSFARHLVSTGDVPLDDGWLGHVHHDRQLDGSGPPDAESQDRQPGRAGTRGDRHDRCDTRSSAGERPDDKLNGKPDRRP